MTPSGVTASTTSRRGLLVLAELCLLGVNLSLVIGFRRLYDGWSFLPTLTWFVLGATVLAVATRRLRLAAPFVVAIAIGGAALAVTWLLLPATARYGLPTRLTWDRAGFALQVSRDRFAEVAAPAPVLRGFQLLAGLALWCAVWFADWAAFRLRATLEALAPALVVFVFGALLGSGEQQVAASVLFAATSLLFIAVHRALRADLDERWITPTPSVGPRSVLRTGLALGSVALLLGVAVGVRLPGGDVEPVVDWRGDSGGTGDRTTVSPIVDLRRRLVDQSDTILFTVRTDQRAYQRLTSLDRFDGQLWTSGGEFSPADELLTGNQPRKGRAGEIITQDIDIRALSALWAPAAFEASRLLETNRPLRWDAASSTLIVDRSDPDSDGLRYRVQSRVPVLDPGRLDAADGPDPAGIQARYEALPAAFPAEARRLAREVTRDADTRYRQALALQNWFRSEFRYSLDVRPGHGDDALVAFLRDRVGYCEQFAGAYAAMARSLGIPARVAVGFTPGEADRSDPDLYRVRGRHAHAWPELWFPGYGWVPFEPTPGRGIPGAESYTGVREEQDRTVPPITISTTTTTSTTLPGGPSTTSASATPDDQPDRVAVTPPNASSPSSGPGAATVVAVLAGAALLWIAVLLTAPAVRRRRRAHHGSGVLDAWSEATRAVRWKTGLRPAPSETYREFARRAARPLGDLALPVAELATLATRSAWAPAGGRDGDGARAAVLAGQVRNEVTRTEPWRAKLRRRLSWREAFDRPRRR